MAKNLKIEITFLQIDRKVYFESVKHLIVRVPDDMKVICRESIEKYMKERVERKEKINKWRLEQGKPELKIYNHCYYIGWSPILNKDKLELIYNYL
jgi:hypothetical protein